MEHTKIQWADGTFNPWFGCSKVSAGCLNCYAEKQAAGRFKIAEWGPGTRRRILETQSWRRPLSWERKLRRGERMLVFCGSWCDVFEDHPDVPEARRRLWDVIGETPNLRWLLLTKRPENVLGMVPWGEDWPETVWMGVTVENQEAAAVRLPILRKIPAALRFISCEPLLGPIALNLTGIHWVIAGGETGRSFRPIKDEWVRGIRDQVTQAGLPFFYKQKNRKSRDLPRIDGRSWGQWPEGYGLAERKVLS